MLNKLFTLFFRKKNQRILLPKESVPYVHDIEIINFREKARKEYQEFWLHDDHLIQSNEYKKQLKILTELFRLSGKHLCEDCEKAAFGVHDYMPPPDFCEIVHRYGLKITPEAMRIPGAYLDKLLPVLLSQNKIPFAFFEHGLHDYDNWMIFYQKKDKIFIVDPYWHWDGETLDNLGLRFSGGVWSVFSTGVCTKNQAERYMNKNVCPLYGAIGGDIIGSRFERHNIKTKEFPLFISYSEFTDDSVLTVATADALIHHLSYSESYHKWGNLYRDAGYGGSFRRWLRSSNPQPYNSWGNGSAMRVSPVGYYCKSESEVLAEAQSSAAVTHNHPEGIKGAQAAALAVFLAKNGADKPQIKEKIESLFGYDLSSRKLDDIRPEYTFDVSCMGTLPVALLAFLESTDYEDAIRNAISVGGDSDTIAAITGGIALAFYKEMPQDIIAEIEKRLPHDMIEICEQFSDTMKK